MLLVGVLVAVLLLLLAYTPAFREATTGIFKAPEFTPPPSEVPVLPNQPEISEDSSLEAIGEELEGMSVPAEDEFLDVNQLPTE